MQSIFMYLGEGRKGWELLKLILRLGGGGVLIRLYVDNWTAVSFGQFVELKMIFSCFHEC